MFLPPPSSISSSSSSCDPPPLNLIKSRGGLSLSFSLLSLFVRAPLPSSPLRKRKGLLPSSLSRSQWIEQLIRDCEERARYGGFPMIPSDRQMLIGFAGVPLEFFGGGAWRYSLHGSCLSFCSAFGQQPFVAYTDRSSLKSRGSRPRPRPPSPDCPS